MPGTRARCITSGSRSAQTAAPRTRQQGMQHNLVTPVAPVRAALTSCVSSAVLQTCARAGEHTAAPARRLQGSIQPLRRARAALAGRAPGSRASSPGNLRVPSKRGTAPCGSSSRRRPPPPAGRGAHSRRAWRGSPLGRTTQAKRSGPASAATQPTVRHPCSSRTARQDGRRPRPTLCPAQGLPAQGARPPRHAPPRLMPQALARRRLCRGLAGRAAPSPAAPAARRPHGLHEVRPPAQRPRASARPACRPCPAAPAGRRGADP